MAITIRPALPDDLPFLEEMFVEAANWDPDRRSQPLEQLLQDIELRRYIEGWGRAGDVGFVAEDGDTPVGAAWRRSYPSRAPGYGFISE